MESDSARARFLTAVSHDMRQPLQALLLYLNALDRRVKDDEARGILDKADRAAQSLAGMFDALVLLTRLEDGKVAPDSASVALQNVFESVQDAGVTAEATSLRVRTDAALLQTILRQVVSNALRHGGGAARLSAEERNGGVEIAVADSGPGIAAEDQQRVFEDFVRLDGARADGLGLGLAIARRLAALLDHQIEVRSAPGRGATFIIRAKSG
jgi:signal transduction histidine kinase